MSDIVRRQHATNGCLSGGKDIDVTNENKNEYVELVIRYRFEKRVKDQMARFGTMSELSLTTGLSFMKGFEAFIPLDKLSIFDAKELELLVGGVSKVFSHNSCWCQANRARSTLMTGVQTPCTRTTLRPPQ